MGKKSFKSQASSSRAVSGAIGQLDAASSIGNSGATSTFGAAPSSSLSYVYEPPDLSNISEPNVVVALKNLQKKDSTTKSKALEELQAYVSSVAVETGGVEEPILEAWIKIYPRTSIATARRVRQLAHLLQGQISVSCGKRIAKYMTQIVSSWLAGLYDNDRAVTRTARESLQQVFNSEEKLKSLWRLYRSSILEYAHNAIEKESIYTLSDERTSSPDDASAKYARVVGAAISMVAKVIDGDSPLDHTRKKGKVEEFVRNEKVWKFASNPDPYLRLAVYRLVTTIFTKPMVSIDMALISDNMLASSLNISQAGSAFQYIEALSLLTVQSPCVWTQYYSGSGKKSATRRLCQYLKRGSQGGPPEHWTKIKSLLRHIPQIVLLPESEQENGKSSEGVFTPSFLVLEALRDGIMNKDEPRANQAIAWNTYLDACEYLEGCISSQGIRDHLTQSFLTPLFRQYVSSSPASLNWSVSAPHQHAICVKAFRQVLNISHEIFQEEWLYLSSQIIQDIRTSLPERSKDFRKSQDSVAAKIQRWYYLQASICKDENSEFPCALLLSTLISEIKISISTLHERNGKPYGAAAILLYATELFPHLVGAHEETKFIISKFAQEDIPKLLLSPSAHQLIVVLSRLKDITNVRPIYEDSISNLNIAPESVAKSDALKSLISSPFLAGPAKVQALTTVVKKSLDMAKHGDEDRWDLVMAALGNQDAPSELTDELLVDMTNGLSVEDEQLACLQGLEVTTKRNSQPLKAFIQSSNGSSMLSKLLFLTESYNTGIADKARNLSVAIEAILINEEGSGGATRSIIEIVNRGIETASQDSLSIDALVEQSQKLLHQAPRHDLPALTAELLPNPTQWQKALKPFMEQSPNPSMSIMKPLASAIDLIARKAPQTAVPQSIPRDLDGYSPALRMAWYVTEMLNITEIADYITDEQRVVLIQNLALFIQLATHNIGVVGSVPLWQTKDSELASEIALFVGGAQKFQVNWIRDAKSLDDSSMDTVRTQLFEESHGTSAAAYYSGCAYALIGAELIEFYGSSAFQNDLEQLDKIWKSPDVFAKAALLASASESTLLLKYCSKLFDGLTGHDFHTKPDEGFCQLVFLSCIVITHEEFVAKTPPQRLVFFVKHLISQLHQDVLSVPVQTEMMKILKTVLAPIKEIYGVFWNELIDAVKDSWSLVGDITDNKIPLLHASLQLFEQLKRLKSEESNDDLQDAWTQKQDSLEKGLLGLLIQLQGLPEVLNVLSNLIAKIATDIPDRFHEPRKIVNELLARQLKDLACDSTNSAVDLYPALASESLALLQSAYENLHQSVPKAQEQVSLDKALTKDYVAKLPEELLSLILAAPDVSFLAGTDFENHMPTSVRSYLLSWKLVYDYWNGSSSNVKADYVACLKDGTYLQHLLEFTFDILINNRSKPVNASQYDIASYNPDALKTPEQETHWLLAHLYYLSLKHLPSLSKAWWRDAASRQTALDVESWTEKYISPRIIASELSTVSEWAPSQSNDTADQPLTVKVSSSAREITASIPVDEHYMQIAIRLPPSYPLARATVDSVHRVGVDEKMWRGWLLATQGVISFSTSGGGDEGGLLIDGLVAWRRNVTATLKGQTECAICYSVVGADRQLPGKRCGTCSNMFHGNCLYRWFKSSNSSSCPLCRNAFHYT